MTGTSTMVKQDYTLTLRDRCDNKECGAPARVIAKFSDETLLMFCLHHGNEHEKKLVSAGAFVKKYSV